MRSETRGSAPSARRRAQVSAVRALGGHAVAMDSLPDAAVVTDLDGKVLIANDAADMLFSRLVPGTLLGQPLAELFRGFDTDPRLPDRRAIELLAAMRARTIPEDGGYETRLADGTSLEIRLAFFTDAQGRPLGRLTMIRPPQLEVQIS